jgi:outer membrane protein TolC
MAPRVIRFYCRILACLTICGAACCDFVTELKCFRLSPEFVALSTSVVESLVSITAIPLMHRYIRLLVLAPVLLGFNVAHGAQTVAGENFPLPETYFPALKTMIDGAAKQAPRILARNAENAIAEAARISARAGQLPTAGGYASYYPWVTETRAVAGTSPTGGSNPDQILHPKKLAYSFNIIQPIYHWGALRANTQIGELQEKLALGVSADAYRVLAEEIRAQYLQVILNKGALARSRFNLRLADEQLALARSKFEKNVIAEADLFGPTISAEQARLATDRMIEDYENSRIYLSKLSGSPVLTDEQVPTEVPPITPATSALQSVAAEFTGHTDLNTYSLQNQRDQIEVERLNYKVAATRLRPKVNLQMGTTQDEFSYSVNIADKYKVRSYFAGVSLSWNVFDGFQTRSAKRTSLARRRQLEQTYKEQTADVIAAVQSQMRQLEFSARNLSIVERNLGSAVSILNQRRDEMGRGVASDADVNAAQLNFYDWQLTAFGARNEYMLRTSRLLSTTLTDPALINVPAVQQ